MVVCADGYVGGRGDVVVQTAREFCAATPPTGPPRIGKASRGSHDPALVIPPAAAAAWNCTRDATGKKSGAGCLRNASCALLLLL
jgi:hypothetical protein